jgi:hypothetical protein
VEKKRVSLESGVWVYFVMCMRDWVVP